MTLTVSQIKKNSNYSGSVTLTGFAPQFDRLTAAPKSSPFGDSEASPAGGLGRQKNQIVNLKVPLRGI
jgi:hypothetical protein